MINTLMDVDSLDEGLDNSRTGGTTALEDGSGTRISTTTRRRARTWRCGGRDGDGEQAGARCGVRPLAHQRLQIVRAALPAPRVPDRPRRRSDQPLPIIRQPQQLRPAVPGDVPAVERDIDLAARKAWKLEPALDTFCHGRALVRFLCKRLIYNGKLRGSPSHSCNIRASSVSDLGPDAPPGLPGTGGAAFREQYRVSARQSGGGMPRSLCTSPKPATTKSQSVQGLLHWDSREANREGSRAGRGRKAIASRLSQRHVELVGQLGL